MSCLHVLLPSRERAAVDAGVAKRLARADRLPAGQPGHVPSLAEVFSWPGRHLPAAALLREHARGDAGEGVWLCADPAWVEVDINGARMMACGNLELDQAETEALAKPLRPLLGDSGALLELTEPNHWQLQLTSGTPTPDFAPPDQVLGANLLAYLEGGGEQRRWRRLFNEVQTELHDNPVNAERSEHGKSPCNALWFWGGGALPAWIKTALQRVISDDPLLRALAARADIAAHAPAEFDEDRDGLDGQSLLDLGSAALQAGAWAGLLALLDRRHVDELQLRFASGERYRLRRGHRWRFWRRAA